ncbi:uncharacterized protein [Parasteatoda tepidariorum]|uniref:uncharacterized protein n=1 Tax=Parasteatoda tepidariorum TaxID=114398 RepID=UPI0039BC469D
MASRRCIKDHESSQTINIFNSTKNYTENYWDRLTGLMKLDDMEFHDLVNVDDAVTVCARCDDNDTIAQTIASCELLEEEDEEIEDLPPNVTNKQALSAVDTVRRFIERQPNMSEETFKAMVHLESVIDKLSNTSLKQTAIESFLNESVKTVFRINME